MTDSAKFPEVSAELLVEALDLDASRLGGFKWTTRGGFENIVVGFSQP